MDDRTIPVTERVQIPREELKVRATRASGPGGQGVNTTSSRVELLWNPTTSRALSEADRARVLEVLGRLRDASGNLRIVCDVTRSQARNRTLATERLAALLRAALHVPKKRKATKPSRAAKEARLTQKKRRSSTKKERRKKDYE
ncbi:MAG TPA: alternative ribosome rescue aminoacyl-tRNA hydrolase ArfB [Gemmatimonadaceae bacterium]|nr:alternative ribosome rescue aminoacyl-tRNA hydrolase ArfB [Gemmatimonadaceae bacterium]